MKFSLVVEDTPQGIEVSFTSRCSGTTDHPPNSLSCMIAARIQLMLAESQRAHALYITEDTPKCEPHY